MFLSCLIVFGFGFDLIVTIGGQPSGADQDGLLANFERCLVELSSDNKVKATTVRNLLHKIYIVDRFRHSSNWYYWTLSKQNIYHLTLHTVGRTDAYLILGLVGLVCRVVVPLIRH